MTKPNNLTRWVAEKMQNMKHNMEKQENLDSRIAVCEPYLDLLAGAKGALEAYGVGEEELAPVEKGRDFVENEIKSIEMQLEFEKALEE